MFASRSDPCASPPSRLTPRAWAWLALSTALVAALHLVGIDWHLPHVPLSDEKVYWLQVGIARGMEVMPSERVFARSYPSMLGIVADWFVPLRDASAPTDLENLRTWAVGEVRGIRVLIAVLSAGILPATWFLARRLLPAPWAALAAGLASISTLSVWLSSMGRPHAVVVVFTTATVAASLRARESGRLRDFALAGAFAALAVGTLQSGACACAAVAAAWWWSARPRFGRPLAGAVLAAGLVFLSLAVFLRGEPLPSVPGRDGVLDELLSYFGVGVHNVGPSAFTGDGFVRFARTMRDFETILAPLAILGLGFAALALVRGRVDRTRRAVAWTVAAHPLVHIAVFGYYGESFQRFWLPIVPYVAVLATAGVAATLAAAPSRWRRVPAAAFAALIVLQLGLALKIAVLRVRDDTHERLAQWITAHPESTPVYIGPTLHVPLVPRDPDYRSSDVGRLKLFSPWTIAMLDLDPAVRARFAVDILDPLMRRPEDLSMLERDPGAWLDRLEPSLFAAEIFHDRRRAILRALNEELGRRGPVIAAFDPQPASTAAVPPIDYVLDGPFARETWFTWTLLRAERLGPEIEVRASRP